MGRELQEQHSSRNAAVGLFPLSGWRREEIDEFCLISTFATHPESMTAVV